MEKQNSHGNTTLEEGIWTVSIKNEFCDSRLLIFLVDLMLRKLALSLAEKLVCRNVKTTRDTNVLESAITISNINHNYKTKN